jgi:phosphoribosylglycinamide formyltransferase-1
VPTHWYGADVGVGVLASGTGSNLDAILAAGLPVSVVVVDRQCRAIDIARDAGVPVEVVERGPIGPDFDRVLFTHQVVDALLKYDADVVAMAGFMTILEKPIFDAFPGRVLNTHPSLLPAFRGAHAVEDALAAGVKVTGCTVHLAVPEVDAGPIVAQEAVPVLAGDSVEDLHERIKAVEHRIYPEAIRELLATAS